jgi:DNA-binding transcriptional LysR family regulator
MTPELRLLRYFVAVADELNFTRAAERLFIAQPSLSAAIRSLERQLGVALFVRDTRRVALTPAGAALLPNAREALAAAEQGVRAARAASQGTLEVLRVLYTLPLEPIVLDALDRVEARDPAPPTTARSVWAGELVRELCDGRADVGVVRFPADDAGLELRPLLGDPLCALVGEDHAAAGDRAVGLDELVAELPVLVWAAELGLDDYNAFILAACASAGLAPATYTPRRLDVPGWLPVVRGEAFALVGAAERSPGATVKLALADPPRMPLAVAWRAGAAPELLDVFADAVRRSVAALAPTAAAAGGDGG